ncbi:unnamed protein product [Closterium sp. NIES-53]
MEGQGHNYATTSDIASLRTDMEQTQATLRRLEAFLTSQPGFATAAAATTATAAPTTPTAVATPTFHGPMAPLSPNLEAARPRLPEAFDPSAKGSDVRRFVATLERGHWLFDPATRRSKDSARSDTYTQQMELLFNRITDLTEGEKIQAYTEGLKMEIRRQVIAANYNSYRDIVRAAERYDALTRGQPETRHFTPNRTFGTERSAPPTFAEPMDIDKYNAKQQPTKCEFCGAAGHQFLSCYKMKKARAALWDRNSGAPSKEDVEPEVHPLRSSQSSPFLVQQLHVLLHFTVVSPQPRVFVAAQPSSSSFGLTGSFPPGTQWSLRRPVYGLRQAPREWHDTLRTTLAALGFAPSTADPSLFLRTDTSLLPFYILVYVDDLVFATADTAGLAYMKSELQKRHTCTDLGELRSYLGLQITRDRARRTITLTQSHMVQQVLQRFGFTYSSPQATPLPTRHSLSALPSDESVESSGPYAELVGCLMYLMTCTRPDRAYPLSILARYVAPGRHRPEHMAAAKRVLRYLCSTSGMGLVLGGRSPVVLTGHADASWADDQATQWSSQGYTFGLGSGSVSWRATRSSSVLGSSS